MRPCYPEVTPLKKGENVRGRAVSASSSSGYLSRRRNKGPSSLRDVRSAMTRLRQKDVQLDLPPSKRRRLSCPGEGRGRGSLARTRDDAVKNLDSLFLDVEADTGDPGCDDALWRPRPPAEPPP